jgi:membrane protease YdiL (CAAX protease family)
MPRREPAPAAPPTPESGYWALARQPLTSLVFVAPILMAYEAGVMLAGPEALRNGADVWLRQLLDLLGLSPYFLLPILTVCVLLAWHHTTGQPWRVKPPVLYGMACECAVLAFCLLGIARWHGSFFASSVEAVWPAAVAPGPVGPLDRLVLFLGAGIYEETLFRLVLLTGMAALVRMTGVSRPAALAVAVVLSSLAFSAAHYVGPHGDSLALASFVFRFVAGAFFSILYVVRGFGIAVGAHAGYDILVGLL